MRDSPHRSGSACLNSFTPRDKVTAPRSASSSRLVSKIWTAEPIWRNAASFRLLKSNGPSPQPGATAKDNRLFVDAVLYRYRAGIPWRDLPERFGDFRMVQPQGSGAPA